TVADGTGLSASGVNLSLVTLKDTAAGGKSYTGLSLDAANASLSGLPDVFSLNVAKAFVRYNGVSSGTTKLNWSAKGLPGFGITGVDAQTDLAVGADAIGLSLSSFVYLSGGFTFKKDSGVTIDDGSLPSFSA